MERYAKRLFNFFCSSDIKHTTIFVQAPAFINASLITIYCITHNKIEHWTSIWFFDLTLYLMVEEPERHKRSRRWSLFARSSLGCKCRFLFNADVRSFFLSWESREAGREGRVKVRSGRRHGAWLAKSGVWLGPIGMLRYTNTIDDALQEDLTSAASKAISI